MCSVLRLHIRCTVASELAERPHHIATEAYSAPMAGLSDSDVLNTLERYGFSDEELTPWRGEHPDPWDTYRFEITNPDAFGGDDPAWSDDARGDWERLGQNIFEQSGQPGQLPSREQTEQQPPVGAVEELAWYLPFHYAGPDWGIYITEAGVIDTARRIKKRLGGGCSDPRETKELCQVALFILYFHEAFHHKVESFATRLEIARQKRVYIPYDQNVYRQLLSTNHILEEAYACFEMHSRLRGEKRFHGQVSSKIKEAALQFLKDWIPTLPPGYNRGLNVGELELLKLMSQIADGQEKPLQNPEDWKIANHMIRGLFKMEFAVRILVPRGATPQIPWSDGTRNLAIPFRKIKRHITRDIGYEETKRGKGSHRVYRCAGRPDITLPYGQESLSPKVQKQVARALGYENIRDLAANC